MGAARQGASHPGHESRLVPLGVILFVVLGLVAIHSVEIWLYGAAFWAIGAVRDFETALYFSTVTFTTLERFTF